MGGGGGGGRSLTPQETKRLSDIVSETIKEAAKPKKNVFISFAAEDLDDINMLRGQAKNENSEIEFNDWSLKSPFDSKSSDYVKRGITERIRQSSVTIVFLSNDTADSKWVDWEIHESIRLGKGVIAMHKGQTPPSRVPSAITENNIKIVPWNHAQLSDAIKDAAPDK
jgi:hypothetical protein